MSVFQRGKTDIWSILPLLKSFQNKLFTIFQYLPGNRTCHILVFPVGSLYGNKTILYF